MKKMKNLRKLCYIALPLMLLTLFSACSKKPDGVNDPRKNYPKNVTIEYRVSKVSGDNIGVMDIRFTNETDADSQLTGQSLPFSKTITKTVNYASDVSLSILENYRITGSIKLEILVNGKVVKTETPVFSNTYITGGVVYQFND